MNLSKVKDFWKESAAKITNIFAVSIIITILIISYITVLITGYVKGREDAQWEFLSYFKVRETVLSPSPTTTPSPKPTPTSVISRKVSLPITWGGPELWVLVNKKRVEYGVNPLNQRDELCTIASIRLNELLELGKLDGHVGFSNLEKERPDLKWIFEKYSVIAEFLAVGGDTPEETVNLWENTLGHKKLLTAGEYVWGCIYAQNTFAVAIAAY